MKPKIIKQEDLKEQTFGPTKVKNILNTSEFPKFSIAKVTKISDDAKIGFDPESDLAYYVLEGEGKTLIEDKEYLVKKGDLIFIPKGTKYKNFGGLTLLAISSPPFSRDKRVREEQ